MDSETFKVDFSRLAWESPTENVRFKVYRKEGRKLRLVEFSKEFIEADWCTNGHIGYVLHGQLEIDFDSINTTLSYGPGDGIFIDKGQAARHKVRILTRTATLILVEED